VTQQFNIRCRRFSSRSRLVLGQYTEFTGESAVIVDREHQIAFTRIDDRELVAFNVVVQCLDTLPISTAALSPLIVIVIGLPGAPW